MREKMVMPHLGILVTTYCNLNCRNCADLIPKRERKHYKIEEIKNDLLKILEVVEFIALKSDYKYSKLYKPVRRH